MYLSRMYCQVGKYLIFPDGLRLGKFRQVVIETNRVDVVEAGLYPVCKHIISFKLVLQNTKE